MFCLSINLSNAIYAIDLFRTFIGEPILYDPKLSCDELAGKVSSVLNFVRVIIRVINKTCGNSQYYCYITAEAYNPEEGYSLNLQ